MSGIHLLGPPSSWLTNSGAINHMTADLSNLSLATPYPSNEMIQTENGEGLLVSHIGQSVINGETNKLEFCALCSKIVPKLVVNASDLFG